MDHSGIQLIPQDLRRPELLMQVSRLLSALSCASDQIFDQISDRISKLQRELDTVDHRADAARAKVQQLSTWKNRVVRIYSTGRYPAKQEIGITDYKPLETKPVVKHSDHRTPGVHIPFSEEVLKEKLLFFQFTFDEKKVDNETDDQQPLGRIPFDRLPVVSSLLMFNSSANPYVGLNAMHIEKTKKKKDEGDAPDISLDMRNLRVKPVEEDEDDMFFKYEMNQSAAPLFSDLLPAALPDLDGVAQDLFFDPVDQQSAIPTVSSSAFFQPVVRKEPSNKKNEPPAPAEPIASPRPVPAPRKSSLKSTSAVPSVPTLNREDSIPMPPAAPPPPPPPPPMTEPAPTASASVPVDSGRASLLDSIRKAGGKPTKGQISVKDLKIEKKKIKRDENQKAASGGDLMSDLMNQLKARRIGISGGDSVVKGVPNRVSRTSTVVSVANESGDPTTGAMNRISAMIPPPEKSVTSDADDDDSDDWE